MFKKLALASTIGVLLAGCGAEKRPYDAYERPAEEITVDSLDTKSLWLYMPSTGNTPRYAITQRGFFQGEPKLVTLSFDEFNGIMVSEVDRDKLTEGQESRWNSEINKAPILSIPGEFREYRCRLNDYDECTNKEEINQDEDRKWTDATHFVPDYEKIKPLNNSAVNTWFTAPNVEEVAEPKIVHYEYDPKEGVINVEVERYFKADPQDQYQFGGLENTNFKTRFFYSLVKLDNLTSKDYKTVHYPGRDQAFYGFFKDEKSKRTATGEANVQGYTYNLVNRFNPELESIDYYLSDSYFEPDSKIFLDTTIKAIADINKVLKDTGVPTIKIVNPTAKATFADPNEILHPGDLRRNVINLVTDPVDNGLLGYGPSATNPLTGEIVHAHVNQYAGVIRAASRRTWNKLVQLYNRQEIKRPDEYTPPTPPKADGEEAPKLDAETQAFANILAEGRGEALDIPSLSDAEMHQVAGGIFEKQLQADDTSHVTLSLNHAKLEDQAFAKHQTRLHKLSEQNVYAEEFMWVSTQSKGLVEGLDYEKGGFFDNSGLNEDDADYADKMNTKLKKWNDLTAEQQKLAADAISAHMYRSTLVHELGHNLGLRHNFMGSVDKANFYQEEELEDLGLKKAPAYSSVMDYAGSIFDELPIYGKYDIAALRFGYGRELEAVIPAKDADSEATSQFISLAKLDETLRKDFDAYPRGTVQYMRDNVAKEVGEESNATLKQYNFCTDEHTTTSVICNRFDEGTDIKELTEFRIQRYKDSYETANQRNDRQSFYQFHQFNYFLNRWSEFSQIRDVIENVEEIDYLFARYLGVSNTNGRVFSQIYANSCPRNGNYDGLSATLKNLCSTYDAALVAADFFLDVLEQPDQVCELEEISGVPGVPNRFRFATLSDLWRTYGPAMNENRPVPTSCYDEELVTVLKGQANEIQVRSQTRDGRMEASIQANNPYQNSVSSVDQLGVWPDKLLAAQMLVKRDSPYVATENSSLSLIDIDGQVERLYSHLSYLSGNPGARQKVFVDKDGNYVETKERYMPSLGKHIDNAPQYLWPMKRFFQLTPGDELNYWFDPSQPDTPTPYFAALLKNLVVHARAAEYGLTDNAQGLVDGISLRTAGPFVDLNDGIPFSWKARNYVATRRNSLAQAMATRALYTPEQLTMVEKLGKAPYRVRNAISVFKDTRDVHEARLIAVGDKDVLDLFANTTGFARFFVFRNEFKKYTDEDTGETCLRLEVDGETEAQRLDRKCTPQKNLEVALTQSFDKFDEEDLPALKNLAQIYGDAVTSNNRISSYAKHKELYDYDPAVLRLWSSNKYVEFRRAFQQLPTYSGS